MWEGTQNKTWRRLGRKLIYFIEGIDGFLQPKEFTNGKSGDCPFDNSNKETAFKEKNETKEC